MSCRAAGLSRLNPAGRLADPSRSVVGSCGDRAGPAARCGDLRRPFEFRSVSQERQQDHHGAAADEERVSRIRFRAMCLIVVKFADALSVGTRHSSSLNIISIIQWRPFSTIHWPRIAGAIWPVSQTNEVM
jgi:hypothetical protein